MPRLTIIIPHVSTVSSSLLEETILSVLENRTNDMELLVPTDGSYHDPYHLSDEGIDFLTLSRGGTTVDCVNAAVADVQDGIACVLFPGTKWGNCSLADVFEVFRSEQVVAAVPEIADPKRNHRVFSSGIGGHPSGKIQNHRAGQAISPYVVLAPHVAGAFFRISALRQWGGLHPALCLQAAYLDFCFLAAQKERQAVELSSCVFWGSTTQKVFPSLYEQARQSEMLYRLWRHFGNASQNTQHHARAVQSELLTHFPSLRMFQILSGRMAGRFSGKLSRQRKNGQSQSAEPAKLQLAQTEQTSPEIFRLRDRDSDREHVDQEQTESDHSRAA